MTYSIAERVEIIALFFSNNESANVTANIFNERHPGKNSNRKYILELVAKFRETGSVHNRRRQAERPVRNEAVEVAVLGHVNVDPTLSTRPLSTMSGIY